MSGPVGLLAVSAESAGMDMSSIRGTIHIPRHLQVTPNILANTRLVLTNHIETRVTFSNSKGQFAFHGVYVGSTYLLELQHPVLHFDTITVDTSIKAGTADEIKVTPYLTDFVYGKGSKLKYPLVLAPSGARMYFEEREEFDMFSLLKSPMVLMMGLMMGLVYVMPKLSPDADEPQVKELKKGLQGDNSLSGKMLKKMVGDN